MAIEESPEKMLPLSDIYKVDQLISILFLRRIFLI